MKFYDLKPTHENLLKTYKENTIGRNKDALAFAEILNVMDNSCSISLEGNWGSGKTFFVKQVKMILDAYNDFVKSMPDEEKEEIKNQTCAINRRKGVDFEPQVCVYYDAWENDNDTDPVLSLIYAIINSIDTDYTLPNDTDALKIAASIAEFFTGKKWSNLLESIKGKNPLEEIRKAKSVEQNVNAFFEDLIKERGNRLVIIIDELDRCKPSYAVTLLEKIKHYFSNNNITFVFAINLQELQHTIKKYYGYGFDACRYLDRFFDLRVQLPAANLKYFYNSIDLNNDIFTYEKVCTEVIETYNYSLREIARFLKTAKIAAAKTTHRNYHDKNMMIVLMYILPIMIGLRLYDTDRYERFISGKDGTPLIEVLCNKNSHNFSDFLSNDETFDKNDNSKTFVTIEEKLNEVYNALFVKIYTGKDLYTQIGVCRFYPAYKEELLRALSLLSDHADINVDEEET